MDDHEWPRDGGAMGALIRAFDWSKTGLGPKAHWPQSLRSAVDIVLASPVAMVMLWGPDGVLIYNDSYSVFAGGRHPKLLGARVLEGWPEVADLNRRVLATGLSGNTLSLRDQPLVLHRHGTPETVWVTVDYSPLRDESGAPAGVMAIVVETTENVLVEERRRDVDDELRRVNETLAAERAAVVEANRRLVNETDFLHGLFEQAPSFMAVLRGPEHIFELANDPCLRLVGERPLIGAPARVALPEVEGQGFFEHLDAVYRSGDPFVGEQMRIFLRHRHEGPLELRILDFVFQPIHTKSGEVVGIFVGGNDVTEQFAANERLRIAQDAGGIGTFEWFPENGKMVVSDEYRRIWGFAPHITITDTMLVEQVHPDDRKFTGPARTRRGLPDNPLDYAEYRIIRADTGETRWVARRGEIVENDARTLKRYLGVAFDITERKRAEAALQELNATLERRVREEVDERSKAEDALRQAQKMEAVGQLTGGIAHDFNNLLQGITGSLDLAQRRLAQNRVADVVRYLDAAMGSAHRAAALTHRLLAFSRRQPLNPVPVDANQLVISMEELLRRTMGEKIAIELVFGEGLWLTRCDQNQLESAFLNLSINARDAMPDGGKLILETKNIHFDAAMAAQQQGVAPGDYICLSVTDTGSGMSAEIVQRAFEPFFTTKAIGRGTGLGLSMVYGFARQSEGWAKIYSEPQLGTTVKIYLPRYRGDATPDDVAPSPPGLHRAQSGQTILVVEDEPAVRDLVVELLDDMGYRTLQAIDGPNAVDILLSSQRIDLLITDIGLPGLNGRQVADAARGKRPGLKILFMTGYAENAAVSAGFLKPSMSMITKPFAMDVLAARIRDTLDKN